MQILFWNVDYLRLDRLMEALRKYAATATASSRSAKSAGVSFLSFCTLASAPASTNAVMHSQRSFVTAYCKSANNCSVGKFLFFTGKM